MATDLRGVALILIRDMQSGSFGLAPRKRMILEASHDQLARLLDRAILTKGNDLDLVDVDERSRQFAGRYTSSLRAVATSCTC